MNRQPPPNVVTQNAIGNGSRRVAGLRSPGGAPTFNPFAQVANARFTEYNVAVRLQLPANPLRVYFFILNTSASVIYVSLTGQPASATVGFPIVAATATALGFYEPLIAPINTISITGSCYVCEGILTGGNNP